MLEKLKQAPEDRLRTKFDPKPIPCRQFDWAAWEDGGDETVCGYGKTEQEAIEDLADLLEIRRPLEISP